jgi:hypothetical protein
MFISRFFKVRYLVALILLVVLVAAIGNAAALNIVDSDHNVVEGNLSTYAADTATVAYSIQGDGTVVAQVTLGEAYQVVSASFDDDSGSGTYSACTAQTAAPDTVWNCPIPDANAATGIWVVAAHN